MDEKCEHNFVVLDIVFRKDYANYFTQYKRITTFFCSKCLVEKQVVKEEHARERPDWFRDEKIK